MHIRYLNINTMSLKISLPFLTRLDKSSATTAVFKPELEEQKDSLQSILYLFFQDPIRFAIRFAQLIDQCMKKLLCCAKRKTADHRVTTPEFTGSHVVFHS